MIFIRDNHVDRSKLNKMYPVFYIFHYTFTVALLYPPRKLGRVERAIARKALENIQSFGYVGNCQRKRRSRSRTCAIENFTRFSIQQSCELASSQWSHVVSTITNFLYQRNEVLFTVILPSILFLGERLGWKEKTDTRSIAEYHHSPWNRKRSHPPLPQKSDYSKKKRIIISDDQLDKYITFIS